MGDPGAFLAARLERSPFWRTVGFRLESCEADKVRVCLPYHEGNTTAQTALHGSAIAATLDAAASLASWSAAPGTPLVGRTLACDVSYLAGALGEDIFGAAEVLRRGKEIVYSTARVVNRDGKLLAVANHIHQLTSPDDPPRPPDASTAPMLHGRTTGGVAALPPANAALVQRNVEMLRKMDGRMPYMAQLGWTFRAGAFGYAEFDLPRGGAALGEDGGIAGGALLSAVDHAGSLAAWMTTELGSRALFGSTVNTKLHTFAPVIPRNCVVRARAAGGCGGLVHSEVSIASHEGETVAGGSTVYRIVERDRT